MSNDNLLIRLAKKLSSGSTQQLAIVSTIMIFRPLIMLTDKAVPMKTRQYAATREFFTELFGLINVAIVAKTMERAIAATKFNKAIKNLPSEALDGIDDSVKSKIKKVSMKGLLDPFGFFESGKKMGNLMKLLNETDWVKLPKQVHNAKAALGFFGGYVGVALATAIITPFLNNIVINDKVLNGIWKFFGQGNITPNSEGSAHGGTPKLDTTNAAAERMLAIMHRANPAQSLNMYQASQQNPYLGFSGIQRAHAHNPMARI